MVEGRIARSTPEVNRADPGPHPHDPGVSPVLDSRLAGRHNPLMRPFCPGRPLIALIIAASCPSGVLAQAGEVRAPTAAGTFYPADPERLQAEVRRLIDAAPAAAGEGVLRAGLVPHAAWEYSGQVAARFYRRLVGHHYEAVVLLAPSHREAYRGISIWPGEGLATPLGIVPVARELAERVVAADDSVRFSRLGYGNEHALEVQLPFLQTVLPGVPVLPLMVGNPSLDLSYHLARTLAGLLAGREVLLLATSDLSHFHDAATARWLDGEVLDLLAAFDPFLLGYRVATGRLEACGAAGLVTALDTARRLGADTVEVLAYTHSGCVTGDSTSVVGYASAVVEERAAGTPGLTDREQQTLIGIARSSVEAAVRRLPQAPLSGLSPALLRKQAAFVTLKVDGALRGCVGVVLAGRPLAQQVRESAVTAALRDERFVPVTPEELPRLAFEVTLLTPLHPLEDPEEIVIGRDGLMLIRGSRNGVLLPQVAVEQGWGRQQLLEQVGVKAGLGPLTWKEPGTLLLVFSGDVIR
jgi:AmmeMemoRadiSam system protein B/AmmeMemoRadiSam system protein A